MIKAFSLEKVNKAGAVFNTQKLDWLNGYYIRQKPLKELAKLCQTFFTEAGIKTDIKSLEKIVATEKDRIKKLADIVPATAFYFKFPIYEASLLVWKKSNPTQTKQNLHMLSDKLQTISEKSWQGKKLETEIIALITENKLGVGDMLWPMRVALSGQQNSPGPFEIAEVLGKKESLMRIKKAIEAL
jgi:glutamyl/glutaminyl-tRNA synthetase